MTPEAAEALRMVFLEDRNLRIPTETALELESLGYVECGASKYQRKTRDDLWVSLTRLGRAQCGHRPCDGSGVCAECNGKGEHMRWGFDLQECEQCHGTGECNLDGAHDCC